ncbi:hypothetical protein AAHE18_05G120900 [Arachis hypogaea]
MSFRAIEAFLVIVWNKKRVGYTYELTLKVKGELNLRGEKSVGGHIDVPEFSFGELDDLQHKVCSSDQPRWKPAKIIIIIEVDTDFSYQFLAIAFRQALVEGLVYYSYQFIR